MVKNFIPLNISVGYQNSAEVNTSSIPTQGPLRVVDGCHTTKWPLPGNRNHDAHVKQPIDSWCTHMRAFPHERPGWFPAEEEIAILW